MSNLRTKYWLFIFLTSLTSNAFAETTDRALVARALQEGTTNIPLTEIERETIRVYANESKERLERIFSESKRRKMNLDQKKNFYSKEIIEIVTNSYKDKKRGELLMRYGLSQALQLTTGLVDEDGKEVPGVLKSMMNRRAIPLILEHSMILARNYIEKDLAAANSGKFSDLPYAALARERLYHARYIWLPMVMEGHLYYSFALTALNHWLATMKASGNQLYDLYASEISDVEEWVEEEQANPPRTLDEKVMRGRELAGNLKELYRRMLMVYEETQTVSQTETEAPPAEIQKPQMTDLILRTQETVQYCLDKIQGENWCQMTQEVATKFCEQKGMRLPSIEELAAFELKVKNTAPARVVSSTGTTYVSFFGGDGNISTEPFTYKGLVRCIRD